MLTPSLAGGGTGMLHSSSTRRGTSSVASAGPALRSGAHHHQLGLCSNQHLQPLPVPVQRLSGLACGQCRIRRQRGPQPAAAAALQQAAATATTDARQARALKVLIAGAGIGGLVLAVALIKKGVDVMVFERDMTAIRGEGKYRGPIQVRSYRPRAAGSVVGT
jgi:ribosomal protein S11